MNIKDEIPQELFKNEENPERFWIFVINFKIKGEHANFSTLPTFALAVLQTPHANADTERTFNKQNYIKNKVRNAMSVATVSGAIKAKQTVEIHGKEKFEPTKNMMNLLLSGKYSEKN